MRPLATSSTKSSMLVQLWTTPGAVGLVVLSVGVGPASISATNTPATAPETMQWAHGYSGCIGASTIGSQPASRSVASLPSMSPLRIAVMGRQKLYWYLASKTASSASSIASAVSASSRAFCVTSLPGILATERTTG